MPVIPVPVVPERDRCAEFCAELRAGITAGLEKLDQEELQEIHGMVVARAAFRGGDVVRECSYCHQWYSGPGLYCRLRCALGDARDSVFSSWP